MEFCRMRPFAFAFLIVPCASPQDQQAPPAPAPTDPTVPLPVNRIRVGGNVQKAKIIRQVQPVYPEIAKKANVSGTVLLHVIVAKDGTVMQIQYISGPPLLMKASMDAVRHWQYEPTLLNGEPVEVETTISVVYTLGDDSASAPLPASALDPQFKADMLNLMELTHLKEKMAAIGRQAFESMRPSVVAELPPTPNREKITDAFEDKLVALFGSQSMTDNIVAIYAKYLSDDDIKGVIQFYQSPAGQHFNSASPQLMSEMMKMGMGMGEGAVQGIWNQLCEEYPELKGTAKVCSKPEPTKESVIRNGELIPSFLAAFASR
jgi:TonB family protein